jgi:hypothetical protein
VGHRAGRFAPALATALDHPAAHAVLTPARLVVAPLFAAPAGGAAWARAIAAALALLALHYLWVLRTDAAVQELGTVAGARWRALKRERRVRPGRREAPAGGESERPAEGVRRRAAPRLAPLGWPATALIWKNLVAASRAAALGRLLALFAVAAAGMLAVAARAPRVAELAGVVAGVWGAMLVIAGPTWVRVDLRHDMPHLPFLRAAPLAGRDVVAAEIAASTIALTAVQFAAFTLLGLATLGARDGFGLTGTERAAAALGGRPRAARASTPRCSPCTTAPRCSSRPGCARRARRAAWRRWGRTSCSPRSRSRARGARAGAGGRGRRRGVVGDGPRHRWRRRPVGLGAGRPHRHPRRARRARAGGAVARARVRPDGPASRRRPRR